MLEIILSWFLAGFVGWCVFAGSTVIADGLTNTIRHSVKEWWFTLPFFAVSVFGGVVTLYFAMFFTNWSKRK
jgi:lipid-A-disaccharide synthase-like uncharacterized protein